MRYLSIIVLSLVVTVCSFASDSMTDKVTIQSTKLYLINKNGKCYLKHNSSQKILEPTPPCFILRNSEKDPQYFSYKDVNTDAVLIVTGTAVSDEVRKE